MRRLLAEIRSGDGVLYAAGWLWLALCAVAGVLSIFDPRTILGIDPWIKPMKFLISFHLYSWSVAWIFGLVRAPLPLRWFLRWGIVASLLIETFCIGLQSARGVPSHFNMSTLFDAVVFQTMGRMIGNNTLMVVGVLVLTLFPKPGVERATMWGARLGLVLFLAGSLQGISMVMQGAHTVGLADGGPGLPFLNWSRLGGDLRVAHFIGLHGLQAVPAGAWLILCCRRRIPGERLQVATVFLLAILYLGLGTFAFTQAKRGLPLLAGPGEEVEREEDDRLAVPLVRHPDEG